MKIDFEMTLSLLRENDDILILTHASPDGDTLGSGTALMLALKHLGKRVKLINNDEIPKKYDYIARLIENDEFDEKYIISVDVADARLLGKNVAETYGERVDLAIDHHGTNRLYAKQTYVEEASASASEIVFEIIEALGVPISTAIADCLYTGCSTDTGCFRYANVTPRTHRIAAKLIELGARHSMINVRMFETKPRGFLMLQRLCLEGMEFHHDGKVCMMTVTRNMLEQTGTNDEDVDAITALSRQIEGVSVGVTFKQKVGGEYKVSVRTHGSIDAAAICAAFDGGGHLNAAGCSFYCALDEAKASIVEEISKYIN